MLLFLPDGSAIGMRSIANTFLYSLTTRNMSDLILTDYSTTSPFDLIRHYDENGKEFWKARELQKMLGYVKWQRFEDAIDRAKISLANQELSSTDHITDSGKLDTLATLANPKASEDYKLSRHFCYLIAMNGDPRKIEIAQAQSYFAIKIREAETVIPVQNDRIRELELELKVMELRSKESDRQDTRIGLHGLATTLLLEGRSDAVVEIDRPVLEVIDQRNNTSYKGQTLVQIKDFVLKKYGVKLKSGADVKRILEQKKLSGYISQTPRSVLSEYIPEEFCQDAIDAIIGKDRQMMIGE
jgi:hypothetical protein